MDYQKSKILSQNVGKSSFNRKPIFDQQKLNKFTEIVELNPNSSEGQDFLGKIKRTSVDDDFDVFNLLEVQRVFKINNEQFRAEFDAKKCEFEQKYSIPEYCDITYGFLTTIKEEMIYRIAESGLDVKLCPYNYLGYNIAGVHISRNVDLALMEACEKIEYDDEVILIVFKYMLGKSKHVPISDGKTLAAPTPRFDSHISEERIDQNEKYTNKYVKSLMYMYEFANINFDPLVRPRHCCPAGAIVFKKTRPYEAVPNALSVYKDEESMNLMRPLARGGRGRGPHASWMPPSNGSGDKEPNRYYESRSSVTVYDVDDGTYSNREVEYDGAMPNIRVSKKKQNLEPSFEKNNRRVSVDPWKAYTNREPSPTGYSSYNLTSGLLERGSDRLNGRLGASVSSNVPAFSTFGGERDRSPVDRSRYRRVEHFYGFGASSQNEGDNRNWYR